MARRGPVYLDYNATTPLDPGVCRAMRDMLAAADDPLAVLDPLMGWGNPSSSHTYGVAAKARLEEARGNVAALIGAEAAEEVVFTSGGTESINHAILGTCLKAMRERTCVEWRNQIVLSATEHVAVSQAVDYAVKTFGFRKTLVGVDADGRLNLEELEQALDEKRTLLVTCMLANNEVGTLQPIAEISALCKRKHPDILVHTDASQAVGKISVDVNTLAVDMLTIAGHKLYAPKGIGALYMRAATTKGRVDSYMHGANHELGRRAGTENVLLSTGLGAACEIARCGLAEQVEYLAGLRDRLQSLIVDGCKLAGLGEVRVNGANAPRLPNTLSISFGGGATAPDLLARLATQVSCSAGAACHSGAECKVSHVLSAMKVPAEFGVGTLRLSVGRFTTPAQVDEASRCLLRALGALRADQRAGSLGSVAAAEERLALPATRSEYMEDTYRFNSTATVLAVAEDDREEGAPRPGESKLHKGPRHMVVLDSTIFHPQGGGQPSDTGDIFCPLTKAIFHVEFAQKNGQLVHHYGYFDADHRVHFGVNAQVQLTVDQRRREWHARIHSAGHLIDQAMLLCGYDLLATKGCHFPDMGPSVEYSGSVPPEDRETLKDALEEKLNALINECIQTRVLHLTEDEACDFCMAGQAPKGLPEGKKTRIVLVGGQRGCPCGGTHVRNTREILKINIKKISAKKGNMKISYEVPDARDL